jgi:hypothetical protein
MKPLLFGIAALVVTATVAEAADGCGRGMFYNGRRCVPQDGPGYGPPPYQRGYDQPVERGPQLRLELGGRRDEGRYSPLRAVRHVRRKAPGARTHTSLGGVRMCDLCGRSISRLRGLDARHYGFLRSTGCHVIFQIQSTPSAEPAPNWVGDRRSSARLNAIRLAWATLAGSASSTT